MYQEYQSQVDRFEAFAATLRRSGLASVDTFVERHLDGQNAEVTALAKELVALALIPLEDSSKMFGSDDGNVRPEGLWYEHLFNNLATPRASEFVQNRLSVVTFNYDRSLEQYLLTALQHTYGVPRGVAVTLASTIEIAHVYGDLGELYDEDSEEFREYQSAVSPSDLAIVQKRLRLIVDERERGEDETTLQGERARALLAQAHRIYFLGFAYDLLNLRRIRPPKFLDRPRVHMSACGVSLTECTTAKNRINQWLGPQLASPHRIAGKSEHKCLEFLQNSPPLATT